MNLLIVLTIILSTCAVFEFKPQTLDDVANTPVVTVQVFYTPFSQSAIDFIRLNKKDNDKGIYALMVPKEGSETEVSYKVEVDFVPWGRNVRKVESDKLVYDCSNTESAEKDADCVGTRLHACMSHYTGNLHHNHHEFFMIVCTTQETDWVTAPLKNIAKCSNEVNDEPDDAFNLETCAKTDNVYLDEAISATNVIHMFEELNKDNDPLIYINGERNDDARTDLRTAVCRAFKKEERPEKECEGVSDGSATLYFNSMVLIVAIMGVLYNAWQ
ncbi:unnamed protein product [Oppiella nova]|uniref:Uncharacterized protein n=1 Tax=Oppiella nova TaxID=334625 RepID=A0A7R9MGE3_9ACAR|nr:unnamed protein product [Oppiella nova]CAG2176554.1 unnamed protein product [Oppiella nova]